MKLTKEELEDIEQLRYIFIELAWRQNEIINGEISDYDLSNRLVSIAWRIEELVPILAALLAKYNKHPSAKINANILDRMSFELLGHEIENEYKK